MSYQGISVREAIDKINSEREGWFLPAVQRPYVWGSRYESEKYICKLFDSILRGYPIGGLILWNTDEEIAYREFTRSYLDGESPKLVEKGQYGRSDKWLVYDGQQRMQTLYSCLKYTFNDKVLVFDLFFNYSTKEDPQDLPFNFETKDTDIGIRYLKMNTLFMQQSSEKTSFRRKILSQMELDDVQSEIVEKNLDNLWEIFVQSNQKSLAYFPIQSADEDEVNEIFERLNSGGMALSLSDLLFSKIKGEKNESSNNYAFEEKLQISAKHIFSDTGNGYSFGAYNILQLINLIVKGRVRVDPKNVKPDELSKYPEVWDSLQEPLNDFFIKYIFGYFRINNASIIPRKLALLPIIVYFYELYKKGYNFKNIDPNNLKIINQYFIKSQINDWNMQSYIDNFTKIIIESSKESKNDLFIFPLNAIEKKINERKQRSINIDNERYVGYVWFSLKILTPNRFYGFNLNIQGRLNPEIDHIFPRKLANMDSKYRKDVDILWNMQPVRGDINGDKLNYHPFKFFTDKLTNSKGQPILGAKYFDEYDFMPNLEENEWQDYEKFITNRKDKMINYMKEQYDIVIMQ